MEDHQEVVLEVEALEEVLVAEALAEVEPAVVGRFQFIKSPC